MTIDNPEINDDGYVDVRDLETRIRNAMQIGVVCHCTRLAAYRNGWLVYYTASGSGALEEHIGTIIIKKLPSEGQVVLKRVLRSSLGEELDLIRIHVNDTAEEVRLKLFDAIHGIRLFNEIDVTQADIDELKQAIEDNY